MPQASFIKRSQLKEYFKDKTVAIVGSGPSVLSNKEGFIDSHEVVVRVNNYKFRSSTGTKTDVHYSFYGNSVRKTQRALINDGVKLCMCKCPNQKLMESAWHEKENKPEGVDYRYIYENRKDFWFCPTYIPTATQLKNKMKLLDGRMPTTGFAAILDIMSFSPKEIYLTGFDFFKSKKHNVGESWRPGSPDDPMGHRPEKEFQWLKENHTQNFTFDKRLKALMNG